MGVLTVNVVLPADSAPIPSAMLVIFNKYFGITVMAELGATELHLVGLRVSSENHSLKKTHQIVASGKSSD